MMDKRIARISLIGRGFFERYVARDVDVEDKRCGSLHSGIFMELFGI